MLVAEGNRVTERDYITRAQPGGYRALHLVVDSAAGIVELQLRTLLQSEWANTFEKLAVKQDGEFDMKATIGRRMMNLPK